jgi:hypothetical protein
MQLLKLYIQPFWVDVPKWMRIKSPEGMTGEVFTSTGVSVSSVLAQEKSEKESVIRRSAK